MTGILGGKHGRVFVRTATTFGTAMGVMVAFQGHFRLAIPTALLAGTFFGAVMALLSMQGERRLKRRGFTAISMEPMQKRHLETNRSAEEAFDAALAALHEIRKFRSVDADPQTQKMVAKIGMTWQSFGEHVSVEITQRPGPVTCVMVSSRPRMQSTVADYGKGVENVEAFVRAFRTRIPDASLEAA